jgi:hypothetical protein
MSESSDNVISSKDNVTDIIVSIIWGIVIAIILCNVCKNGNCVIIPKR